MRDLCITEWEAKGARTSMSQRRGGGDRIPQNPSRKKKIGEREVERERRTAARRRRKTFVPPKKSLDKTAVAPHACQASERSTRGLNQPQKQLKPPWRFIHIHGESEDAAALTRGLTAHTYIGQRGMKKKRNTRTSPPRETDKTRCPPATAWPGLQSIPPASSLSTCHSPFIRLHLFVCLLVCLSFSWARART